MVLVYYAVKKIRIMSPSFRIHMERFGLINTTRRALKELKTPRS
jgi:hypothetical protein